MPTRHCQRCGSCIIGNAALAEIHSSGASPEATVLCPDCTWLIRSHLAPVPEMSVAQRYERSASVPDRGGLDRHDRIQFADLIGKFSDAPPIAVRRR